MKLLCNALTKFICGLLLVGLLLFLPAGGFDFWNGWLFIGLLFIPMTVLGIVLFCRAPSLLAKRLDHRETERTQKGVVALSGLLFLIGFIAAGLDFRFGWSHVPMWCVIAASVILLVCYGLYAEVMRENAYLSRTIEVQENQKVVDTGLYGIVRHPMYAATILLFIMMPLVLGSWYAAIIFLAYPVLIVIRLSGEEKLLLKELPGYGQYREKVKYRIIPFIW